MQFLRPLRTLALSGLASLVLSLPVPVLAQLQPVTPFSGTSTRSLPDAVTVIINTLLILVAIVAVIFIMIGGIRYITAGSNESGQEKAKNTILYGVIGILVVGLAAVIVNFAINTIGGTGGGGGGGGGKLPLPNLPNLPGPK